MYYCTMRELLLGAFIFLSSLVLLGQPSDRVYSRAEYINMYKDEAVKEMNRTGIPASITLAQGILESGDGNSPLARYANNHFGIKCHDWDGPTFIQDDDAKNECFRKYRNPHQSFKDHSEFLSTRNRYAFLFDLRPTDYVAWAYGLKQAGYATNPKYPDLLIKLIEENELYAFDRQQTIASSRAANNNYTKLDDVAKPREGITSKKVFVSKNNIKYTYAQRGDTPSIIASRQNMGIWQIKRYNNLEQDQAIAEGTIIYLQPKRRKAKQKEHVVQKNETPWLISQKYGIKLERLCYYNSITKYSVLTEGTRLKLRP